MKTTPPPKKISRTAVYNIATVGIVGALVAGFIAVQSDDEEVTADCVYAVESDPFADTGPTAPADAPVGVESERPAENSYVVVDDDYCDDDGGSSSSGTGVYRAYHWYYGGVRNGGRVSGGTSVRPSGVEISSRDGKSIQRGGFGRGFSGGG
ncbi:hypothetical protein [Nonomuraea longicatena]|uniref:Uncharacterized protein n=1 Tax=Nonomuraea longicatena TaxID=83682 RepID=A0ABN1NMG9_9ACTN